MANCLGKVFQFREFSIRHDHSMAVGTDSVLLGAWASMGSARQILDIGTGSGLIALMMAQRSGVDIHIDAVEPDPDSCEEAGENIRASPWAAKIALHQARIQDYPAAPVYDLIVSNPPYFGNDLLPPLAARAQARHTIMLSHEDLLVTVRRLLSDNGRFNIILPTRESIPFIALAFGHQLHAGRRWAFRTRADKPVRRLLLEFSLRAPQRVDTGEILLYQNRSEWSPQYRELTCDFYLSGGREILDV